MSSLSARYAQLIGLCRRRGCTRDDADDLVQEAYLRLLQYERSTKVRDMDSLLRRIVINLSISHYHRDLSTSLTTVSVVRLRRHGMLVEPAPEPERTVAAEQQLDAVADLLNAVSPRTCQILMAQRGGYSYAEIANAFGVKPRTVEKHVASALAALRERVPAGLAVP
jgi:RNA polymerase sigma factor (sigma-70 family)